MAKLSNVDLFRKVPVDLTQASRRGGLLSITVATVIGLVLFCEVWTYLQGETKSRVVLDNNAESKLEINFEISFFELPCRYATIEVWDYLGNAKLDVSSRIRKTILGNENGDKHMTEYKHRGKVATEHVEKHEDSHLQEQVVDLNSRSYGQYLKQNEYTFVLYYVDVSQYLSPQRLVSGLVCRSLILTFFVFNLNCNSCVVRSGACFVRWPGQSGQSSQNIFPMSGQMLR